MDDNLNNLYIELKGLYEKIITIRDKGRTDKYV